MPNETVAGIALLYGIDVSLVQFSSLCTCHACPLSIAAQGPSSLVVS